MSNTYQNIDTLETDDFVELGSTYAKHKIENMSLVQVPKFVYKGTTVSKETIEEVKDTQKEMVSSNQTK